MFSLSPCGSLVGPCLSPPLSLDALQEACVAVETEIARTGLKDGSSIGVKGSSMGEDTGRYRSVRVGENKVEGVVFTSCNGISEKVSTSSGKVGGLRKRKCPTLEAPSNDTLLLMSKHKSEVEKSKVAARLLAISQKSSRPLNTTSTTYSSLSKKFVEYRVDTLVEQEEEFDLCMKYMSYENRLRTWVNYIYALSDRGIYGKSLASHLSATKAFMRSNASIDMSFCDDSLQVIKDAKFRANSIDRQVLREASLKRDANVKLPVFEELTDVVYEMAFEDMDDWSWQGTHRKGAATAQILQTLLGVRISNSVKCRLTDHHFNAEDVVIKFEEPSMIVDHPLISWVLTCGNKWEVGFNYTHVQGIELREQTGKGKVGPMNRFINRVDVQSDRVCLAVAAWAQNSGVQTGEPFFTMRRFSPITKKVHVCYINDAHVNFVIKDASAALGLGTSHYSSHSARSGFVTKHSWAERVAMGTAKAGGGAGASDGELAQMGGWTDSSSKGAMKMHYDRTSSVYRSIALEHALTRADIVSMLSLHEQDQLPKLSSEDLTVLRNFRRVVWGTSSTN